MAPDLERIVLVDPSNNSLRPRVCSAHRRSGSARFAGLGPIMSRRALQRESKIEFAGAARARIPVLTPPELAAAVVSALRR